MFARKSKERFSPGVNLGVLGGGQLGRMFAIAARELGFHVHVFAQEAGSPAGQVADSEVVGDFLDDRAIQRFAARVDLVTFEVEHVPFSTIQALSEIVPVRPDGAIVHICQNRLREKKFLVAHGFPVTPFAAVCSRSQLAEAVPRIGLPAILKTADGGYDGMGQHVIAQPSDAIEALANHPDREMILEHAVDLALELSVLVARGLNGEIAHWGVIANRHAKHVLDISIAPAEIAPELAQEAIAIATEIARQLDLVGVLCVEFFLDRTGRLMVNELAPRPHNSGHLTIEASATSQFEQQVRAICGLPLGSTAFMRPAAMANLLGNLWRHGTPHFQRLDARHNVRLHLYGKTEPRPGRKMGHLTAVGDTAAAALYRVCAARNEICVAQPPEGKVRRMALAKA